MEPLLFGHMNLGLRQGGFCVQSHYGNDLPCGTKFLLEFIFADWQFLCFEETIFCDQDRLVLLVMNEFLRFSESPAKSLIMYEKAKGG